MKLLSLNINTPEELLMILINLLLMDKPYFNLVSRNLCGLLDVSLLKRESLIVELENSFSELADETMSEKKKARLLKVFNRLLDTHPKMTYNWLGKYLLDGIRTKAIAKLRSYYKIK